MNSECESHYRHAGRKRGAVEGNCVAARRGGEQPETEGWSRTRVNSIRHLQRVSLLAKGEACCASGESVTVRVLPILDTERCRCGWSGNDRKGTWDKWRDLSGCQEGSPTGVRASIVALKPGNAGGAKGRRKTNCTKSEDGNSHRRLPNGLTRGALDVAVIRQGAVKSSPVTGSRRERSPANGAPFFSLALVRSERSSPSRGISSIGEPDAGNPPVRFGGRGGATQCSVPTPILVDSATLPRSP